MLKRLIGLLLMIVGLLFSFSCSKKMQGEDKVVLRYMLWGNLHQQVVTQNIIRLFEKKHPKIKVRQDFVNRDYWTKLQTMFAGGTAPDVMLMSGSNYIMLAKKGVLKDITPFIERDRLDINDYYSVVVECYRYKSKLHALPLDFKTVALYYNKTMFDKESLSYPDESWTWKELVENAVKLTKDNNGDGKMDQWGLWFPTGIEEGWNNFVWQNMGELLNKERTKCMLDSPEAVEAIQFVRDLYWKHKVTPAFLTSMAGLSSSAIDPFMSGKIGMRMAGVWKVPSYRDIRDFDWDVAPLPKGKVRAASANGLANSIYEKTKYPEEAWKLVKFLSSPPAQEMYAKSGRAIPILKKLANSEVYLDPELKPYNKKVFLDEMEYAHDLEFTANWNEWIIAVQDEFALIWLGKVSVEEGCKRATKRVNKLLREIQE